jgi:translation elongation factor EF-1alpha
MIPISAWTGDNLKEPSPHMEWFKQEIFLKKDTG